MKPEQKVATQFE